MIVCLCHRVSDRDIRSSACSGCADFDELQDILRVGTGCGACAECAREVFREALSSAGTTPFSVRATTVRAQASPA